MAGKERLERTATNKQEVDTTIMVLSTILLHFFHRPVLVQPFVSLAATVLIDLVFLLAPLQQQQNCFGTAAAAATAEPETLRFRIVVYGATPGGISAALSAASLLTAAAQSDFSSSNYEQQRDEKSDDPCQPSFDDGDDENEFIGGVLLIEPTAHVGGMATEGGIGLRDAKSDQVDLRADPRNTQYQWGKRNADYYRNQRDVKVAAMQEAIQKAQEAAAAAEEAAATVVYKINASDNETLQFDEDQVVDDVVNNGTTRSLENGYLENLETVYYQPIDEFVWQPDHWVGEDSFWQAINESAPTLSVMLNTDFVEGPEGIRVRICEPSRLHSLILENGTIIEADYFIDSSYTGDLMKALSDAGVLDTTFGRESSTKYDEPWGGITNYSASQFKVPVSPLIDEQRKDDINIGEMEKNLIPYVWLGNDPNQELGKEDGSLMGYSYRVCLTRDRNNFEPITPPENYDPADFELARRLLLAELQASDTGYVSQPWLNLEYMNYPKEYNENTGDDVTMKYDACCGGSPMGIDAIGSSRGYATATRGERAGMMKQHRYYVQGLLWFWRSHPDIPLDMREEKLQYGLCRDSWSTNGHFPRQLYVREALRLVGDKVFTQHDRTEDCKDDSIAVGAWGLDVHDMRRIAFQREEEEIVVVEETETDVQKGETAADNATASVIDSAIWLLNEVEGSDFAFDYLEKIGTVGNVPGTEGSETRKKTKIKKKKVWHLMNEGLRGSVEQQGGVFPFEIPYWTILPKRNQLANFAVVSCPSASHIAFAAIRVEPTLWTLGQAAGTAAAIASNNRLFSLHNVNVTELQESLLDQGVLIHARPEQSRSCIIPTDHPTPMPTLRPTVSHTPTTRPTGTQMPTLRPTVTPRQATTALPTVSEYF